MEVVRGGKKCGQKISYEKIAKKKQEKNVLAQWEK